MKVKVSRRKWGRGTSGGALLNEQGKMCCLGFACKQVVGARNSSIKDQSMPIDLVSWYLFGNRPLPAKLKTCGLIKRNPTYGEPDKNGVKWVDTKLSMKAAEINDSCSLTDAERESRLKRLFRRYGHTITFVP